MLILNADDVKYCHVVYEVAENKKVLPGIIYRDKLFAKAKVFEKDELDVAIKYYREKYLDNEERRQNQSLVIQEKDCISLWRQDDRLKLARVKGLSASEPESQQPKSAIAPAPTAAPSVPDISAIVAKMRSKDGFEIKARPYKLKLYHRCFVASEAVDWLVKNCQMSREEAIAFGQNLVEQKIIHHICDEHHFKDENLFYRFYEDEGKSLWTDKLV
ncbi:MAG: DEP domain-containing protein [Xenococcaceae cyanobacterium]